MQLVLNNYFHFIFDMSHALRNITELWDLDVYTALG